MEGVSLTRGAIADISNGGAADMKPVLQVVDLKLVQTVQNNSERFRMVLSDGTHAQQAMLATQMNGMVKSEALQKGSIVQLKEFICNLIQNRKIIIVLDLDVLVQKCNTIGEPRSYDGGSATSQGRPAMPSPSPFVGQPGITAANLQSHGGSLAGGPATAPSVTGGSYLCPKTEPIANSTAHGGSSASGSISGWNTHNGASPLYHKAEPGARSFGEALPNVNHNQGFSNPGSAGGLRPHINNYGHSVQPTYQQPPPPLYTNRGPIAKNEAPVRIIPIAALNPYQGRWTIKARVTAKGDLRRYNNTRGEGKVFSFDLLDSEGGEIRVTCFNMVADQFYDQIEVGKVYLISKGSLKPSQKNFNHLNNEYEIFLDSMSTIQPCLEEDHSIPRQQFNFRPISEIEAFENNSMVDVIGIVSSINPAGTILRKNGTETHKRTLQLKDMSGRSVELTLWGNFCNAEGQQLQEMCDSGVFPVLAVKAGRVNDFSGKALGTILSSQLFIDPDFPEAQQLKDWYNREGKSSAAFSISRDASTMGRMDARKTVSKIKDEGLGRSEKPDWITVKATVTFIKVDNFCYTACPLMVGDRQCNKKVNNNGDGTWHCDRCDQYFPECDYRYIIQFQLQDHTGLTWVTAFQESGQEIMGVPAKELYLLKYEEQDDVKFAEIIRRVLFNEYLFKLKVKEEMFSDEQRVKSTVVKAEKVNPSSESRYLLGLIDKLSGDDPRMISGRLVNIASESRSSKAGCGNVDFKPDVFSVGNNNRSVDRYHVETSNPMGQYVNEYGGTIGHSVGSHVTRGIRVVCNSCGSTNHSSQNCPSAMNGQGHSTGGGFVNRASNMTMDGGNASSNCFKCQQPGHWARDCPGTRVSAPAYGSNSGPGKYGLPAQRLGGY